MVAKQEKAREAWKVMQVDGLRVLFLRCEVRLPACIQVPPHHSFYNAIIGAKVGTIVQCLTQKSGQDTLDLWVDDEALIGPNGPKPLNFSASAIAGQPIFGDALLMTHGQDGNPYDLPHALIFVLVEELLEVVLTKDEK